MLTRRDLLAFAGLGAGNLMGIGCTGPASMMQSGHGEVSPFIFLVYPSRSVSVLSYRGFNLGEFEAGIAGKNGATNESTDPDHLLSEMPEPLVHVARYSLNQFRTLEDGNALSLLIIPNHIRHQKPLSGRSVQGLELASDVKGALGKYFIRVSIEKHYVGSCIKRNAWHAGVLVRDLDRNALAFDLHIASWLEQRRPCFGVYESARGFCRNVCEHPNWDILVAVVYAALVVGLVAWLAWAMASVIAAAVLGALIVIPGVPPPP